MLMNNVITCLALLALLTSIHQLKAKLEPNNVIELDGAVEVSRASDNWLKVSVPFLVKSHPGMKALDGRKPSSMEELFNPEYLNNLNIKITICFRNDFKRKYVRGDKGDIQFNDYYSAELEVKVLKVDRSTKTAHFLFPTIIAERDEYAGSTPKPNGYVVEFSRDGEAFNVSDSVVFEKYSSEDILEKFKSEAISKSIKNKGILIPAHLVDASNLRNLGPVAWEF